MSKIHRAECAECRQRVPFNNGQPLPHDDTRTGRSCEAGAEAQPACRACGKTLAQCNAQPECSETNNYEHDIPGHRMVTTLTKP